MSRVDLYPRSDSGPDEALIQTGTSSGQKVGADVIVLGGVVGNAIAPADYTSATVAYPTPVSEVYTYFKGATAVKTVTITYTNAAKTNISSWVIT